ncbi:hypothetical protein AAVH_27653, partial [Aphelenchoides avenae]
TAELDEVVVHEVGVHVTNGADGTWRPAPHDHGKCFTDVAPVLTEKTGVAVDVEHTVETGKKMRNLALELPDEPDWEHSDWLKSFARLRKSKKARQERAK